LNHMDGEDAGELAKLAEEYLKDQPGFLGNTVLYDLCKSYPRHDEEDVIASKIWLIGRAYAAAIERGKNIGM